MIGTVLLGVLLAAGIAAGTSHQPVQPAGTQALAADAAQSTVDGKPRKREQPVKAANPNCTLTVPANPLSAGGLATPYVLSGTQPGGDCHETNAGQSAFVEAAIVNPATGALSLYRPLVIDRGTQPATAPKPPALPAGAVVGIWFGFNGDTLTLRGTGNSLTDGRCVNGLPGSTFGQFAHCDAPAFFASANSAIAAGKLAIPALGTGKDGQPCPTVRDFGVVDQDQSDNVTTTYLSTPDGRTAQATGTPLPGATTLTNGSDNRLLDAFIDPALGCSPFTAPDLTANGAPATALALDELQAAAHQGRPVALVPLNDPMTLVDGNTSVAKTNLYRSGVDQPAVNPRTDTPQAYCTTLATVGNARLVTDAALFHGAPSPDAGAATLFDFLTQRLQGALGLLNCP
jgi:hypothetical protein